MSGRNAWIMRHKKVDKRSCMMCVGCVWNSSWMRQATELDELRECAVPWAAHESAIGVSRGPRDSHTSEREERGGEEEGIRRRRFITRDVAVTSRWTAWRGWQRAVLLLVEKEEEKKRRKKKMKKTSSASPSSVRGCMCTATKKERSKEKD